MSKTIDSAADVPRVDYFVVARYSFMSGWGLARGKINIVILPVATMQEANVVLDNAKARTDMKQARVSSRASVLAMIRRMGSMALVSLMDRYEASTWYEPGAFALQNAARKQREARR